VTWPSLKRVAVPYRWLHSDRCSRSH
jgi:hypothetical protein